MKRIFLCLLLLLVFGCGKAPELAELKQMDDIKIDALVDSMPKSEREKMWEKLRCWPLKISGTPDDVWEKQKIEMLKEEMKRYRNEGKWNGEIKNSSEG